MNPHALKRKKTQTWHDLDGAEINPGFSTLCCSRGGQKIKNFT